MPELGTYGSMRGEAHKSLPYRDQIRKPRRGLVAVGVEVSAAFCGRQRLAELLLGNNKVVVCARKVGIEADGFLELGDGVVELALEDKRITQVVVGFGVVGIEADGFL